MAEKKRKPAAPLYSENLKRFVRDRLKAYKCEIGVSHYAYTIVWCTEEEKYKDELGVERMTHAKMLVDRRYQDATMTIFPPIAEMWRRGDKEGIADCIAHEVAHVATQHLYQMAHATFKDEGELTDAWETLTTVVGRLAYRLDEAQYGSKK